MTDARNPSAFLAKADRALNGARLLLAQDDSEGACSRAYYAMFDAAHAAIWAVADDAMDGATKTHSGLVTAVGRLLVRTGKMEPERGRALNQVQRLRQVADYVGEAVCLEDARWPVAEADLFVAAAKALVAQRARAAP